MGKFDAKNLPGGSIEIAGLQLVSVGSFRLSEKLSVLGKAGVHICNSDKTTAGFSESDCGTVVLFGVGIGYDAKPAIRGEWERIGVDDSPIDFLSVSIVFSRGGT